MRRSGYETVATRSVQLPTGSAMKTSGRVLRSRLSAASTRELKRQQKQPPGISSTGKPLERSRAVSTRPLLWSLLIRPTRLPWSVRRRARRATAVVLPAPRKPPIMMYRAGAESRLFGVMALSQHLVDGRVEDRDVALDVQAIGPRRSPKAIQPSSPGRVRLNKSYFLHELRVPPL